jgi:hypothetical protein
MGLFPIVDIIQEGISSQSYNLAHRNYLTDDAVWISVATRTTQHNIQFQNTPVVKEHEQHHDMQRNWNV